MTSKSSDSRTGLWRTASPRRVLKKEEHPFPLRFVFPSGRQLLSHIVRLAGLGRINRVAFPEWSSHCVVNAIARYATPIPFKETVKYNIKADAVLIYEQWGWPITGEVMEALKSYVRDMVFILDMVDSAHFNPEDKNDPEGFRAFFRFTSLSKLLGLAGGGIGVTKGRYIRFSPEEESKDLQALLEKQNLIDDHPHGFIKNVMKNNIVAVSTKLQTWLNENALWGLIEQECASRQHNLKAILKSPLAGSWPSWMRNAVENGAGPGVAPLLRGASDKTLERTKASLLQSHQVETEIYHFNWSGNPLEPVYEKCLAFPVHGMVQNIENLLRDIEV